LEARLTLAFDRLLSAFLLERYEEVRATEGIFTNPLDIEASDYFLARLGMKENDLQRADFFTAKLPPNSSLKAELDGRLALLRKEFDVARNYFSLLLDSKLSRGVGLTLIAASLVDQDNFEHAWPLLFESFNLKWNDPETISGLITVGNRLGFFKELEPLLLKYLYRSPADMDVRSHYALSLIGQGKIDEATLEVLRILAFESGHPIALELHSTLVAGGFL